MVTQTTKPQWNSIDEARKNQELGFACTYNMFKKIYLPHLLPNFNTYQSVVIRWLTRIMRQDMIPGQDELIKTGSGIDTGDKREFQTRTRDNIASDLQLSDGNPNTIFTNMDTTSREMDIARKVAGTWPENIVILHDLFRRAFLNYQQPASMKRVVNVYKEWICNGGPNQRIGYTSFGDLLQIFVLNSSNAFVTRVSNPAMLDEQVEMCKRIMNIYRYMVMKIYMNTNTWEQLLNVMLSITEKLFPLLPPEKKETTIGGRIAPAFFQTFIVSWIRANLYVHISDQMWIEFHKVMKNLIKWRELIEEWSTSMSSLTRVLVKHVYGLTLTDLPLDKPQERRRRPRAMKSFSTAEALSSKPADAQDLNNSNGVKTGNQSMSNAENTADCPRSIYKATGMRDSSTRWLIRSNSDGILYRPRANFYYSSAKSDLASLTRQMRKIKSEYLPFESGMEYCATGGSTSTHNDVISGLSLRDPNMILDNDQAIESQHLAKFGNELPKSNEKQPEQKSKSTDKCVLLGGTVRGWTPENSVIMWRRMLGLFGDINHIEDPDNHIVAMRCLAVILCDFIKTRDNLGISIDNQSTPEHPNLIPPYMYIAGWLLEATHLPRQFKESRLTAFKLLCMMNIRRHDIEVPQSHYTAFYEALHRGLSSPDPQVHASIIKNSTQLLSLELPGCTMLVKGLFERSRSILLTTTMELAMQTSPQDQAIQILSAILTLNRPIKKLMTVKSDMNNTMNLVAPSDIKTKILETFLACNMGPIVLGSQTRCRSLCAMTLQIYQELCDNCDSPEIEKVFDTLLMNLQDASNSDLFRINCDLLRLFADHANLLSQTRPALLSSIIQIICQLIVRFSTNHSNKDIIFCLLLCLQDWCISVGKNYLQKPVDQLSTEDDDALSTYLNDSLITIVLQSLESVMNDEQFFDETSNKGTKGSVNTSKASDVQSNSQVSTSDQNIVDSRDRTMTNDSQRNNFNQVGESQATKEAFKAIKLACKVTYLKLVIYLGHFPLRQVGAASLSCCVDESDYLAHNEQEITDFNAIQNINFLVIDGTTIITFIGAAINENNQKKGAIHLIIRNLCGKYSWDSSCVDLDSTIQSQQADNERDFIVIDPECFQQLEDSRMSMKYDSDFNEDGNPSSSLSSRSSTNRDCIEDLMHQLNCIGSNGSIAQSCQNVYKKRNSAQSVSNSRYKVAQAEETMIALLTNQRFQELNYCERYNDMDRVVLKFANKITKQYTKELNTSQTSQDGLVYQLTFEQCRQLIQQLGYLSWEKRSKIDCLTKSSRLIRELKNLDSRPSRETHKIAVLYVANGQEDKNSILLNSSGSKAFEEFVSGLGWEINLASHLGFRGGLQSNKSTGETSPYYCNSTTEVMFHVSTRIPIVGPSDDESLNRKLRHLGNDEIHIVWSEHVRDYRRGIIPTEFGDVLIVIYPMLTFHGYYRIQILSKPDVPIFGPLFDNSIIHQTSLAPLVRATAINASRAKRLKLPYFQSHFEERSRLIETIVQNHRERLSFEDFASQLYYAS